MKFTLVLAALTTLAAAQSVIIHAPVPQSTISSGDKFVVDVERENNLILSNDVSVAIGLLSCANDPSVGNCAGDGTSSTIGRVLFSGPYAPKSVSGSLGFAQNYTVTVPADFPAGTAALSVAHFFLLGSQTISASAHIEVRSELVVIA